MPYRKRVTSPTGVTKSLATALTVWTDAPSWAFQLMPGLSSGSEYIDLDSFCRAGPPSQLAAPWDQPSIVFPYSLTQYLDAKLNEKLFNYYCEAYGDASCTEVVWDIPQGGDHMTYFGSLLFPSGSTSFYEYCGEYSGSGTVGLDIQCNRDGTPNTAFHDGWISSAYIGQEGGYGAVHTLDAGQNGVTVYGWPRVGFKLHMKVCGPPAMPVSAPLVVPSDFQPIAPGNYPDLATVGKALDALLLFAMQTNAALTRLMRQLSPSGSTTISDPVAAPTGTVVAAPSAVIGAVITLFNVPAGITQLSGLPNEFFGAGRVTFGGPNGWAEPIPIRVTPMLVLPVPAGCTEAQLSVPAPITATISWLRPA